MSSSGTSDRGASASPVCEQASHEECRRDGGSVAPMAAPGSDDSGSTTSKTSASNSPAPGDCCDFSKGDAHSEGEAPVKRKRGRPFGSKDKKQRVRRRKGLEESLDGHFPSDLDAKASQQHSFDEDDHHLGAQRMLDPQAWRPEANVLNMLNGNALLRAVALAQQQQQLNSLLMAAPRPQVGFGAPALANPFRQQQLTAQQINQLLSGGLKFSQPSLPQLPHLNTLPALQSALGQGPLGFPLMARPNQW